MGLFGEPYPKEKNKIINKHTGLIISIYREQKGLEQTELAKKVGVSQPVISRLESGAASWTVERFFSVCNALNIDAAQVFEKVTNLQN